MQQPQLSRREQKRFVKAWNSHHQQRALVSATKKPDLHETIHEESDSEDDERRQRQTQNQDDLPGQEHFVIPKNVAEIQAAYRQRSRVQEQCQHRRSIERFSSWKQPKKAPRKRPSRPKFADKHECTIFLAEESAVKVKPDDCEFSLFDTLDYTQFCCNELYHMEMVQEITRSLHHGHKKVKLHTGFPSRDSSSEVRMMYQKIALQVLPFCTASQSIIPQVHYTSSPHHAVSHVELILVPKSMTSN